jgi:zinc D-Ala-D-Ala dipeptidase
MKLKLLIFLVFFALLTSCTLPLGYFHALSVQESQQMVVVTSPSDTSTVAQLRRYVKKGKKWIPVGTPHPVVLGRTGLAWGIGLHKKTLANLPQKQEGDGKSPAGIFALGPAFGYSRKSFSSKFPYIRADLALECVDDGRSEFYNLLIDTNQISKNWSSSERMQRQDNQYKWGLVVRHNLSPWRPNESSLDPRAGSCIFLHIWESSKTPTAGCTAMSEENLLILLHWLKRRKNPILVQLTERDYELFRKQYELPSKSL